MSNPNVSEWDAYLDKAEERAKSSGGGGDFVNLKSGETVEIVFVSSGFPYHDAKFKKNRELFVVYDVKQKSIRVLDMSTFFVGGWVALLKEYGPMYRYTLKREGAGQNDTRYTLTPKKDGALSEDQIEKVRALPRPELAAIAAKKEGVRDDAPKKGREQPAEQIGDDDIPF
jgi:hypothetical protein